jgi:hypothetical protein
MVVFAVFVTFFAGFSFVFLFFYEDDERKGAAGHSRAAVLGR